MAITDTTAIKFVNEQIRPKAETMRNLYYLCLDTKTAWENGMSTIIVDDENEDIEDGREDEGVSRLTGADIHLFIDEIDDFITLIEKQDTLINVSKPCVRPLEVR